MLTEIDHHLIREYDEFTKEKAKLVTAYPVSFRIVRSLPCHEKNATAGANLTTVTDMWVGRNAKLDISYEVRMAMWLWRILRNNRDAMEKIICHELAHIKHPDNHDENFRTFAAGLGAGECAQRSFDLDFFTDHGWIARVTWLINCIPYKARIRFLYALGGSFTIHKSIDTP